MATPIDMPKAVPSFSATRRDMLLGSLMLLASACSRRAADPTSHSGEDAPEDPVFLGISITLTGYRNLSPVTSARLSRAFAEIAPDLHVQIKRLAAVVKTGMTPASALAAATAVDLEPAALVVVAAWYTGTVGTGEKTVTVSYLDALMQRPVADVLLPPTYVLGGPAWWTAAPPDVGLAPPVARAPAPHTVGTPEPKK